MVWPGMNYERNRKLVGQVISRGVPCKYVFESRKSDSGGDGAGMLISGAVNGVNIFLCFHKGVSRMSTVGMQLATCTICEKWYIRDWCHLSLQGR